MYLSLLCACHFGKSLEYVCHGQRGFCCFLESPSISEVYRKWLSGSQVPHVGVIAHLEQLKELAVKEVMQATLHATVQGE